MGEISIDDLLNALQNPDTPSGTGTLENNSDTWRRIGEKDRFDELGLTGGELSDFLTEWTAANPYENI
jgi:hypothetical protein